MNSPLPAYYEEPATEPDQPIDIQTFQQDNAIAPEPYPKRTGRGLATLPNVTLKQHRIAAIAGGAVTLFALGGFGLLLAFAPRGERDGDSDVPVREMAAAAPAVTEPAPVNGEAAVPTMKPAAARADTLVAASTSRPASVATSPARQQPAAPATRDQTVTASVTAPPAASPRWGNSTTVAEAKAEALTAALSSGPARTPSGAAAPAVDDLAPNDEAASAKPAPQEDVSKPDTATTAAIAKPEPVSAATARPGRVSKHVNLRSGPDDDAKVLRVVPAKASLSVIDCKSWCEVVYEGTRGYVYKGFVN